MLRDARRCRNRRRAHTRTPTPQTDKHKQQSQRQCDAHTAQRRTDEMLTSCTVMRGQPENVDDCHSNVRWSNKQSSNKHTVSGVDNRSVFSRVSSHPQCADKQTNEEQRQRRSAAMLNLCVQHFSVHKENVHQQNTDRNKTKQKNHCVWERVCV